MPRARTYYMYQVIGTSRTGIRHSALVRSTTAGGASRAAKSAHKGKLVTNVSVKRLGRTENPRRRKANTEGFRVGGIFHPIRSGDDYDPEDVGERYAYAPAKRKKAKGKKKAAKRKNPVPRKFPVGKFVKVEKIRVHPGGKKVDVIFRKGR